MSMTFWFEWSLPLWECGLKFLRQIPVQMDHKVTPLVGVWIEIGDRSVLLRLCVVTPLVGVWIEIPKNLRTRKKPSVTPLVGVWIEIFIIRRNTIGGGSLPLWECGLKL